MIRRSQVATAEGAAPAAAAPEIKRCAHCLLVIPEGWRQRRIGKHTVCWDCRDAYPLARLAQLEAALADITTKTTGKAADLARAALYSTPRTAP